MLFFKRILNFDKRGEATGDKRLAKRHAVGLEFALKAAVVLVGRDGQGNPLAADLSRGRSWGGVLSNMSRSGVSIRLHIDAEAIRGEPCQLKLALAGKQLEVGGKIAHFKYYPRHVACGIALVFSDPATETAYRQLLEPVMIGATLKPVKASRVKQEMPGMSKEQYAGDEDTVLNIYREQAGKALQYFELLTHDFYVRGGAFVAGLQVGRRAGAATEPDGTQSAVPSETTAAQSAEIRQLFSWVIPNLATAVPDDVRDFLQKYAS